MWIRAESSDYRTGPCALRFSHNHQKLPQSAASVVTQQVVMDLCAHVDRLTLCAHTSSCSMKPYTQQPGPMWSSSTVIYRLPWQPDTYAAESTAVCAAAPLYSRSFRLLLPIADLCECALPGAELRWRAAEANHRYLQGGGPHVLGGCAERPRRQEGGAQRRAEAPAEMQRGARSTGHAALLLITLLILTDGRQLLHQAAVALPVHLRGRQDV